MLCRQTEIVMLVAGVCRELGVELHHCSTATGALEKFKLQRFHGVIVDDQDPPNAALLLRDMQASGKKALIIALAKADASLEAVFGAGTHLVIYKPLTHDRLRNGLRAIRPLMGRQQPRASSRVKVDITASLTVNGIEGIPAKILDISTGGVAVCVQRPLPTVMKRNTIAISALRANRSTMVAEVIAITLGPTSERANGAAGARSDHNAPVLHSVVWSSISTNRPGNVHGSIQGETAVRHNDARLA
jgi:hypothetical protein